MSHAVSDVRSGIRFPKTVNRPVTAISVRFGSAPQSQQASWFAYYHTGLTDSSAQALLIHLTPATEASSVRCNVTMRQSNPSRLPQTKESRSQIPLHSEVP